ncbi:hypothetical protein OHT57_27455 [Streptomyces sp. NBC_00285]|uniref:hypothetical protein n=1 Tax=Streptomyces sp. NBC_00285 TaxID=2975700 RepID=UPI002E2DBF7F|nr:hypothetical protein [Streptomyces sp. NBC_00285]
MVDTVIENEVTVTGPNKVMSYACSGAVWAFGEQKRKLILRPPGQVPLAERLRQDQGTAGSLLLTFWTAAIAGEHV